MIQHRLSRGSWSTRRGRKLSWEKLHKSWEEKIDSDDDDEIEDTTDDSSPKTEVSEESDGLPKIEIKSTARKST